MEKKIFLCFAIAAVVGISAWAFILGGIGTGGEQAAGEEQTEETTETESKEHCLLYTSPSPRDS